MKNITRKCKRGISFALALFMLVQCSVTEYGPIVVKASTGEGVQVQKQIATGAAIAEVTPEPTVTPTPAPNAEDMIVTSSKTLSEDMIVNNLTISSYGTLNLSGYQLTVLGDINLNDSGEIVVNAGSLICKGNCNVNGSYSYISMDDQNDYVKICGDFTTKSESFCGRISDGILELQGDFTHLGNTAFSFYTTGMSEVIFSGTKEQYITFSAEDCYFECVTFNNSSKEGIVSDGVINSYLMNRNNTKITCGVEGTWGWKLTEDEIYEGNLILIGDTLDLNGHTLEVTGNLIQMNGIVDINGGTLKVAGDYRMEKIVKDEETGENVYIPSVSGLQMLGEEDVLDVNGTLCVGDFYGYGCFKAGGDVKFNKGTYVRKLVLDGTEKQEISSDSYIDIYNFEVKNTEGCELLTSITASGHVNDNGNPVTGEALRIDDYTTFENNSFSGSISSYNGGRLPLSNIGGDLYIDGEEDVMSYYPSLCADTVVGGDLVIGYLNFNGYNLDVKGNAILDSYVGLGGGRFTVHGDLSLIEDGYFYSVDENSYVLVKGNMNVETDRRVGTNYMSAGTLELQGDFTHSTINYTGNFCAANTHTTIFSGTGKQTVIFADEYSYFGTVEINNTSEEGVYAPQGINCITLNKNGNVVNKDLVGVEGWTLTEDETYTGTLELTDGVLDLNGHTLTVTEDFIQADGQVKVNGGKLVVQGDYIIQSKLEEEYGRSYGYLNMTNEKDVVVVEGSFVMGSNYDHTEFLTNGTLKVAGDVSVIKYESSKNFACGLGMTLELNGTKKQTVTFDNPAFENMSLGNFTITNESEEGVVLSSVIPVAGVVTDNNANTKVDGTIVLAETTTFDDTESACGIRTSNGLKGLEKINGNLILTSSVTLDKELNITGDLFVEKNVTLNLNGYNCTVGGNIVIKSGNINLNGARLNCNGDLTLSEEGYGTSYIRMQQESDYLYVKGDFYDDAYKNASYYTNGTMEIKGDFIQSSASAFYTQSNCKVILSGISLQTVRFENMLSYFYNVEITNTSQEGVYSENGINCFNLETNGNVYTTGKEGRIGWTLEKDEEIEGDLSLAGGKLDLNGHKLVVKGNLSQKGGIVKLNGGELVIEGDYAIADGTKKSIWAILDMSNESDILRVFGDFTTLSAIDHRGFLKAGIMYVGGDFTRKTLYNSYDERLNPMYNFSSTMNFTLVLNGESAQNVNFNNGANFYTDKNSYIANLVVDNSSESGINMNSTLVTGNVNIRNGKINDYLAISRTTKFENNIYEGNIAVDSESFRLNEDFTIKGDLYIVDSQLTIYRKKLTVSGNVILGRDGSISLNRGELVCYGNLYNGEDSHGYGAYTMGIEMTNEQDIVSVYGNVYINSDVTTTMTNGTLEVKGDFWVRPNGKFVQGKNCKTVFSGDSLQTISIEDDESTLGTVVIENESKDGVYFKNDTIKALDIVKNENRISCDGNGECGWTLKEDTIIEGDLIIVGDELNLNGYELTVNGNLILRAGSVNVNNGSLIINGNFQIQSYNKYNAVSSSNGQLLMTNTKDKVIVKGDFITSSSQPSAGNLTEGVLEIQGDFIQSVLSGASTASFASTQNHTVVFNGTEPQIISFDKSAYSYSSYLNNVTFDNPKGVTFAANCTIKGSVTDTSKCTTAVEGYRVYFSNLNKITDGTFGASIYMNYANTLTQNLDIGGELYAASVLNLNGYSVKTNNYTQYSGKLSFNSGRLYVADSFNMSKDGSIAMEDDRDYLWVKGNFVYNSTSTVNSFIAGTIEACGDVTVAGSSKGFTLAGTHTTILSGKYTNTGRDYVQNITLSNADAKFNKLVLTKNPNTCYVFNRTLDLMCNSSKYEAKNQVAPEKVTGLEMSECTESTVKLTWNATTDDESVAGYQVYRGSKIVGITDETEFTDYGLSPETTYTYKVCAYDKVQNLSEDSEEILATTTSDVVAPTSPTGVKIEAKTGSSITISWNGSTDNVKVDGYKIYRDSEFCAEVASNVKNYKDAGLSANESHSYRITAVDANGNESVQSEKITTAAVMPKIVSITPKINSCIGGKSVTLTLGYENWGNSTGNKVRFQVSEDEGATWQNLNKSLVGQNPNNKATLYSTYTWNISKYENGRYLIRAILYDADNNTDSIDVNYEIDTTGPITPENIMASSINGTVMVSWSESDTANCSYYVVYRALGEGAFSKVATVKGRDCTTYVDTNVLGELTYSYYVIPVDEFEQKGEASEIASVQVTLDTVAPTVNGILVEKKAVNADTVFRVNATDNVKIANSYIEYLNEGNWVKIGESDESAISVAVNGVLPEDGIYSFRAVVSDTSGNETVGQVTPFEVDQTGVTKPVIKTVTSTSNQVKIIWQWPNDKDFDYYVVEKKIDGEFKRIAIEGKTLGVNIENLEMNTEYTFRVVGYDTLGNKGVYSDEIVIRTKNDTTSPVIKKCEPEICRFTDSIPLKIQATDNNGLGDMVISYSLDEENWVNAVTLSAKENSTSYTYKYDLDISELPEGEIHVRIDLYDACGNKHQGMNTRTFYRDLTAPNKVEINTASGHDGCIYLEWEEPKDKDFASYALYRMDNETGEYDCIVKSTRATDFADIDVDEKDTYFYKLCVKDQAGNQSEFSDIVKAKSLEDITKPKVHAFLPKNGTVVGANPTIQTIVSDNRRLKNVYIEYHKVGADDYWTEIYNENINKDEMKIFVPWENEMLEEGDYEIRVIATDEKGNISDEYITTITYSKNIQNEPKPETISKNPINIIIDATYVQRCEKEYIFDATSCSSDGENIITYFWDFGDGTTTSGEKVTHIYEEEGDYTVRLVVEDANGNSNSETRKIKVVEKFSGGINISVCDKKENSIPNAIVCIEDANGEKILDTCTNDEGVYATDLETGTYTVSVYKDGYLPQKEIVNVIAGATRHIPYNLEWGDVVEGHLEHRQLSVKELIELGVDLEDKNNWYTYEYTITTVKNGFPTGDKHSFVLSPGQTKVVQDGDGRIYSYTVPKGNGAEKVLVQYCMEKWVKQMFNVKLTLFNRAEDGFTVTDGVAELVLPEGLSLLSLPNGNNSLVMDVPDIEGQTEEVIEWYVKGDEPGDYALTANFNGTLLPFEEPISSVIESELPLVVTEENENTSTDPGFTNPDEEKTYELTVEDLRGFGLMGAYVQLEYNGLYCRAITDSKGKAYLKVNENDSRNFHLSITHPEYNDRVIDNYRINGNSYTDSVGIKKIGLAYQEIYWDYNEDYEGDFLLEDVYFDNKDLVMEQVTVNSFISKTHTLKLKFSEDVVNVQVLSKSSDKKIKKYVDEDVYSNVFEAELNSSELLSDCSVLIKVLEKKRGTWHVYKLNNLTVEYAQTAEISDVRVDYEDAKLSSWFGTLGYTETIFNEKTEVNDNKTVTESGDSENKESIVLKQSIIGTKFKDKKAGIVYKVTKDNTSNATVEFVKVTNKNVRNITIPSSVQYDGVTYKVTSIARNAFKGCKKLKCITIKTKKLSAKRVGTNAFKGIHKKAKIKVPKSKLHTYKKILRKCGVNGSKQKIAKA